MTEPTDGDPVTAIRHIGPAQGAELARAGITTATRLRQVGAHDAYRAMMATGTRPHFIGYYALHMALQGRPWNDCKGPEKDALRVRFDALKAELAGAPTDSVLERMLDEIGTGRRR
ncbi:TfoX/Sxy family protein [Roseicyclus persicicus]|uniref:TfoX/Sxy family protein n=1 Tax=Roseicyclus persicicus TaxID=2650661 RepID=A0A7X6GYI1_9RHOB|nr:TfoX/Sxy family protein [Roseibacterium persicicum]NKX44747.1 TfoX/Sxy family protein [Roseibacterium persicicum]